MASRAKARLSRVWGLDPSLTSAGLSDGVNHHVLIKTVPSNDLSPLADLARRIDYIIGEVQSLLSNTDVLYVESAMLNGIAANHLYETGAFNITLHRLFGDDRLRWVTPSTLKKFITGKGNAPKKHDPAKCGVGKKPMCVSCGALALHGMTFEKDAGKDKLHAWGLAAYGAAVEAGTEEYKPLARRGQGKAQVAKRQAKARKVERESRGSARNAQSTDKTSNNRRTADKDNNSRGATRKPIRRA